MIFNSIKKTNLIISHRVRLLILFTMIISIFSILFETISIGMVVPIITTLLQSNLEGNFFFSFENNLFYNKDFDGKLKILLIFLSLIFILKIIFSLISAILKMKLIHQFNNDLQLTLFKKYIFMDWEKYISRNPSILIRNIQSECSILKSGIVDALIILITEIIFFIFIITLLILFIPTITLGIIFLIFAVSFIFFNLIKTKIKNYSKERLKVSGFTCNYIIETLHT